MNLDHGRALLLVILLLTPLPGAAHNEMTLWEAGLELYTEPPLLVTGEPAQLVMHLTTLADQQPLREGALELVLRPREGTPVSVVSAAPVSPGIHILEFTPESTGMHTLVFRVAMADGVREIEVRGMPVYTPEMAARFRTEGEEDDHEHDDEILFPKEAQWRMAFSVEPARRESFAARLNLPATIEPAPGRQVDIVAPARGMLRSPAGRPWPHEGQPVRAGEAIAELVPVAGIDDLGRLRADLETADARLRLAEAELARVRGLVESGALPERRLIEADAEVIAARGTRDALRERLTGASGGDSEATGLSLIAALDGMLIASRVAPGQVVDTGDRIASVLDTRRVWLRVRMTAQDMARLNEPHELRIRTPGGRDWRAPVDAVPVFRGAVIEDGGLPLVFEIDNPGDLVIGLPLIASLAADVPESRITIPATAVLDDDGIDVIIVQNGGEVFERRPVRLGPRAAGRVAVLDGLEADERVVVDGAYAVLLAGREGGGLDHGHTH